MEWTLDYKNLYKNQFLQKGIREQDIYRKYKVKIKTNRRLFYAKTFLEVSNSKNILKI